jgi:hypothetical protein
VEFSPPASGLAPPSYLDDGLQSSRLLPNYPSLQPDIPAATLAEAGEQLAYSHSLMTDLYGRAQMVSGMPPSTDAPRSTPFMQEQAMSSHGPLVEPLPFGGTTAVPRPVIESDNDMTRYGVVPAYGARGGMIVGDGSEHTAMYHDPRYDALIANPMNRPAARRGPFKSNDEREKTAQTRKIGSCVRCRMQRIRVRKA